MKIKTFILTFLMMSCSIVFGQGTYSESAKTEAQIMMHLANDEVGTITIANNISIGNTIEILNGRKVTIDLNGHELSTNEEIYIFKNFGKLTITDSDPEGKGTIIAPLGIYNGKPQTRTISTDINYNAQLTINGGKFVSTSSNVSAAIYNHLGVINIRGGEFYGEYSAITNYGMANIENTYIECLNRDNGAAAIINDFEIEYGENVRIVGRYTTATETGVITPSDYKPTYLFAELDGTKYPSLQAALDACTTGDNTINLLFHNSDNATVSQKEGVNITIDGNGYKGKQFEYTGTIYVNGNSRHTGAETLTIQDVDFYTEKDTHDFISCNSGSDPVIRYAHNVTVQNCNFNAKKESTAVVALRFRQSYNINVKDSEFTNLHSAMWATGTSGIAFDNIEATKCKEGGISAGTSTPVSVKNSTIEGAKYGVRADGSGAYSLTVENSTLEAEVPVIVRNTTGDYNLTVKEDATLTATNGGPQVVVTDSDNKPYVVPTSDVNVTLYDNVTSTFGLTAKIGNAFYATLQDAVDNAKTGETVTLIADNCKEDVTVTQAPNYAITIDGAEKTFKGTITVDGKSARYETTALTIKNVNFDATEGISADACINLGVSGNNNTRYTNKVTVENCTFTDNDYSSVAIKSYTGGDRNLVVKDCEANGMHSLAQLKNIEQGLVISGNIANTKNGINLNQTAVGTIVGNEINVKGYAVRIGESTGGNITLNENTLKTDNTEGDPVIELRGTVVALNMEKNVVSGNTHIKGTAGTISVDANYWDGKEAPVVAEGSAPIVVNSYYSDATLSTLVRNEMGSIYAFVSSDRIFGDVTTNAKESIKIEIIGKDGHLIGTSSLEKTEHATGFNKQLTWRINLGDDDSDSWAMAWEEGCPSINNMPAKVKLYVDAKEGDAAVAEAEIKYTANGDGQSPVFAAKTNAEGKINSFIACTGEFNLSKAANKLVSASADGDNIAILVAGTYNLPTGKNLTITGAVENVKFDMSKAVGINSSMTFNNVTFEYGNANYVGLQHAGTMVYNNCIINGQVFLYGTSETFNNCTFNQNSSGAYNVWTYGAKEVAFNECTFNSAGKSVLVYNEGACATDLTVTDTKFFASATVDDKAAIEIDCSLMPKGTSIVIEGVDEGKTTATGFGENTKSGSSLWNDKKVVEGAPNGGTSSEVIIDDVVVKEPALMNLAGGGTEENPYLISNLEDLIWFRYQVNAGENNYAGKYVKLAADINLKSENWTPIGDITYDTKNNPYKPVDASKVFSGVFDGNNKVIYNLTINKTVGGADTQANVGFFGMTGEGAVIKNLTLTDVNINTDGRNVGALIGYTYMATIDNITVNGNIQINGGNNVSGVAGMTRYYTMSATNIKVVGNDGSAIVGNNIVGGIFAEIAPNGSEQKFENLSVENVAITGVSGVGGIVGLLTTGAVNNVTVKNVVLTGRTDYQGDAMGRIRLGSVSGLMGGQYATISNVTTENVTAKNLDGDAVVLPIIGANYDASSNATEAKIGDTYYATLQTAINAVKDGETVTLVNDITYTDYVYASGKTTAVNIANGKNFTLNLNGKSITGTNATENNYELVTIAKGTKLTIEDSSADKTGKISYTGTRETNDGWMHRCHTIFNQGTLVLNGGTIENNTPATAEAVASAIDNNASWGNEGYLTVNGGTVISTSYYAVRTDVNTHNTTTNGTMVAKVELNGGTIYGYYLMDRGNDLSKLNDIDFTVNENAVIEACEYNGQALRFRVNAKSEYEIIISDEAIINGTVKGLAANIGNSYFATLQDAVDNVKEGNNTINLLADVNENVTVSQVEGINIVIDGKNYQFDGTIYIEGNSRYTGGETLTIQNVNFYTEKPDHDFIASDFRLEECVNPDEVIRYAHNVTVKGCNFATSETNVNNTVVGLRLRQAYDIAVENCTSNHIFSLMWSAAVDGLALNNVTVENCTEGITISGASKDVTITGSNITSPTYGIRASVEGGQFTMTNSTINALVPVVVRNDNGITNLDQYTLSFTFEETNTITESNPTNYWFVAGETEYKGTSEEMPTAPKGNIIVNLNDNGLSYDGVYGNFAVAKIGDVQYLTFEAALNAVNDGETIELFNITGSEINKEIEFTKDIEFTITGEAPNYALPVVTFQNATVNIKDAEILIPELDARQNATINVINSTVYDAGGNSIAKSYYNGALNISGNSKVYMMQVTTMGYINISDNAQLHATWQTNVYGNGLITLNEGATFATAGLNLIAKEYSGRDNTDAGRVGKPAEIVVNGANFTVGKVYSASGADYSYNADGYGINVGTIEGKSAILTIKNGGNVNIYTGNGKTANIGADGTVNIDASTFNVVCRAENGTATLASNGTVNVTGASNLAAANVTGNGWFYMNGVTLDANTKLLGAKVRFASGTNNIDGSTINDGFFQVGIGAYNGVDANVDTENGVVVNVKNAVVGANGDTYAGWAGTGFYDTDDEKAAAMTNAKYVLNIENSIAEFGYLHVSNDGELNVKGDAAEKKWYNNSDYSFYAGEVIINGKATFDATDVLAFYTKVSCDNDTDNPGTLNIVNGTEYEAERHNGAVAGLNFDIRKTGIVNVAEGADLHVGEPASIAADATMNIGGTATVLGELTNNGTINFTSETATLTVPTTGLEVNNETGNNDIKVVYENGTYKFIDKHYVAEIDGGAKYETLAEAATAAQDGETIQLLWNEGDAPISMAATFVGNKTITITGTANVDWSTGWFYVGRGGEDDGHVIFDNAKLTSVSNSSAHGINVSGRKKGSTDTYNGTVEFKNSTVVLDYLIQKNVMTLDNSTLTVKNGCSLTGRLANETENGELATSTTTLNNGSKLVVNGQNGMDLGYEGYGVLNIDATSTFEATENYGIAANGTMNVNGGNVKVAGTLTNNGTMNVATESNVEVTGNLNVNGTLNSAGNITANIVKAETATIQLNGGIYTTEPQDSWCAESYGAVELPDGTWFVRMLAGTQTREFANAGWYWFSTYIQDMEGQDGLTTLKSELDGKGKEIKSQHGGIRYYPAYDSWTNALTSLSTSEMYMINTTDPVTVEFNGDFVEYESRTINLVEGWNWIGYPVSQELDINVALKNLQAKEGDYIKGKNDDEDAWFVEGYGWWSETGDFKFKPGHGYMYLSQQATSFTFNAVGGEDVNTDVRRSVANNYHWNADATQYPSNMTMVAVVDGIDDNEYEVAAFVNGEVRGSARPAYFEPLDTYILVLTIHGDDVEEMTFKYYDLSTNTEYDLNNKINYSNDAIVGSIYEPYMLTRGTTGIGEAAMSQVNIYPNPTTTGTEINLEATCDKVEVFNALGVKVVEYQNVDTIDALETAGIYVIRITNNGNVQNCRLVVK